MTIYFFMNLNHLSDEQIVEIVLKQDKETYVELIKRYQIKLSHYLRKFISDLDDIEDVLQLVFIKAYRNLYNFKLNKKFSSWIYRIAHNEAISYLRKYGESRIPLDEVEYKLIDKTVDMDIDIDRSILKKKVEAALVKLKFKYREPLILYYFEQKSYQEISDILRLPTSTVGTLLLRAKKLLKSNLLNLIL